MNPDRPIDSLQEDGFNYYPLAKQLAPHLLLKSGEPSLVVGVEAPWGSGKTSFLNLTRHALKALESAPLIFEYCPWVYSTVDSLILGFCIQIAAQLSTSEAPNYKRISSALLGFSQALKPLRFVPGAELAMGAVDAALKTAIDVTATADELNKWDIANAKERVQKALADAGKPIVVFVDDVDRLPPTEVRLLFQFLKAVADFNGVAYVVAYDPIPVEDALSYGGKLKGREYLKKFIQLPLRLPRLSRLLMRNFLSNAATHLQKGTAFTLSSTEWDALKDCAVNDMVLNCLKTPRDVVRCFNLLRLRIADCYREVQLPDLLKYIILDLVSPESVDFVRQNSALFLGPLSSHPEFFSSGRSRLDTIFPARSQKDNARQTFSKGLDADVRSLLDSLFPSEVSLAETDVRSAHSTQGLIKLLFGGASPMAFSVADAEAVLQNAGRRDRIQEKVSAGVFREWVYFISALSDSIVVADPCDLASELIVASDRAATIQDDAIHGVRNLTGEYLTEILAQLTNVEEAVLFVETIISHEESLEISHRVVLTLATDAGLWKNGESFPIDALAADARKRFIIPPERILALERKWIAAVQKLAREGFLHKQPRLFSTLHRWGQFSNNDYSEPQDYIRDFCERQDPLLILAQSGIGVETGGLEKLLVHHGVILDSLSKYEDQPELRQSAIQYLKRLQTQPAPESESAG